MSDTFTFSQSSDISASVINEGGLAALRAALNLGSVQLSTADISARPYASNMQAVTKVEGPTP